MLLLASGYFYLSYSPRAAVYLGVTILLTYAAARRLSSMNAAQKGALAEVERPQKAAVKKQWVGKKRKVLGAVLIVNFLTLAVFKYFDSWFHTWNLILSAMHIGFQFKPLELLLPLGISFYIFQTSGYLLDVYKQGAEKASYVANKTLRKVYKKIGFLQL